MRRGFYLVAGLASLLSVVFPQSITVGTSIFAVCGHPLILYTEWVSGDNTPQLHCATPNGSQNLGLEGSEFSLAPSGQWLVYSREHGPYRQNGSEYFGYQSLYIYDLNTNKETRLLTDMGHVVYFWLKPANQLMISFWLNTLGFYENEYPSHFVYEPEYDRFIEMKWPNGRIAGCIVKEDKCLLFTESALFLGSMSLKDDFRTEAFALPDKTNFYTVRMSPDGDQIAYLVDDTNSVSHPKTYDRAKGVAHDLSALSLDATSGFEILEFSPSGKYSSIRILGAGGSEILGIYSFKDGDVIFKDQGEETGLPQSRWLDESDILIFAKQTSRTPYSTDIYSFDTASKALTQLTSSPTIKMP